MKKILLLVFVSFSTITTFCQTSFYKKKPTLSVNFMMNDFKTAELVNKGSIGSVLKDKTWSKFSEMSPGLAINYYQGLTNHIDFMGSLGASIVDYTFKNRKSTGSDHFLLEADASIMAKLLSDQFIVNPFVTAGVGISMYKVYWGAYVPAGFGIQFKLAENTFLTTQAQYRTGVSELSTNHFNYSLGFGTPIGGGKKK